MRITWTTSSQSSRVLRQPSSALIVRSVAAVTCSVPRLSTTLDQEE